MSNASLYTIIHTSHYMENYADNPETDEHLKHKGSHEEVIVDYLTYADLQAIGKDNLQRIVDEFAPESNRVARYTNGGWELVELNEDTVRKVKSLIDDMGPEVYNWEPRHEFGSDHVFGWAIRQLPESYHKYNDERYF